MTKIFQRFGGLLLAVAAVAGLAACDKPEDEESGLLYLSVSPAKILFSATNVSQNVIDINTNSSWTVTVDDPGLELSSMSGKAGRQSVAVTKMAEGQTCKATFTTTRRDEYGNPMTRVVSVSTGTFNWAELPETKIESGDYKYIRHYARTIISKKDMRNYSACYDTRRHNPMYVAFPYHAIYHEGGFTRTDPDPWRPDPDMEESEQSIIYRSDWEAWPWTGGTSSSRYSLWANYPFTGSGYYFVRGHMMRSAERGAGKPDTAPDLNVQTFYPANIAPERYMYDTHWAKVEGIMPTDWVCADTVYCVVGCHYATDDNTTWDASSGTRTTAGVSKKVVIPTARYKVFLRTKSGNTGKSIAQCNANQVMAIGFWFEQNFGEDIPDHLDPPLKTVIYSVEDIERMTGNIFDFFPQAPEGVKGGYNITDWPGLSAIAN